MEQFNILVNKMDEKPEKIKSLCNLQDMFEDKTRALINLNKLKIER